MGSRAPIALAILIALGVVVSIYSARVTENRYRLEMTQDGVDVSGQKELNGKVDWKIKSESKPIPARAHELHQQGRSLGGRQKYSEALKAFDNASKLAPEWAYPVYDAAFTYLLMGDTEKAFEYYKQVDALEPNGFFTSKTAVWALQKESEGQFPAGTYLEFVNIEFSTNPDQGYTQLASKQPKFAPVWQKVFMMTKSDEARADALEKGLACDPDVETKGMLLLNKASQLNEKGQKDAGNKILNDLISSDWTTQSTKTLAKEILKMGAR